MWITWNKFYLNFLFKKRSSCTRRRSAVFLQYVPPSRCALTSTLFVDCSSRQTTQQVPVVIPGATLDPQAKCEALTSAICSTDVPMLEVGCACFLYVCCFISLYSSRCSSHLAKQFPNTKCPFNCCVLATWCVGPLFLLALRSSRNSTGQISVLDTIAPQCASLLRRYACLSYLAPCWNYTSQSSLGACRSLKRRRRRKILTYFT